jgi:riboflavin kinase / FMN adenylyltransferase
MRFKNTKRNSENRNEFFNYFCPFCKAQRRHARLQGPGVREISPWLLHFFADKNARFGNLHSSMKVHRDISTLPEFHHAVVTIGTFDGVHLGHRQIIRQLKQEAGTIGGETVIITFHPHPRKVIAAGKPAIHLLNTLEEKATLLEKEGIDHLVVVPFTESFARQSASEYVNDFLIRYFNPHTLIIGYDHKFGRGREGDFHLLEKFSAEKGFQLIEIPQHLLNESTISSTRIREALLHTRVSDANQLLGYQYFIEGIVVEGNKLGRTIGYPTANLAVNPEKLIPGNGVYAVKVMLYPNDRPGGNSFRSSEDYKEVGNKTVRIFGGMMNIGVRPTVDGSKRVIEVNIFRFDEDIYGQRLKVEFVSFLRGEQKFEGLEKLKEQLAGDKRKAESVLINRR